MNRSSLANEISKKLSLSRRQAENLVIAFGAAVTDALERGEKVIYSNFGSFYVLEYPSKTLSHPKSGQKMVILPTRVAKFMPADQLKKLVNGGIDMTHLEKIEKQLNISDGVDIPISITKTKSPVETEKIKIVEEDDRPENIPIQITSDKDENQPDKDIEDKSPSLDSTKPDLLSQAHADDDIEKYHQHKESEQASNIYEEILSDGSSEVSTIKDTIRVHRERKQDKKPEEVKSTNEEKEDENKSPLELLKMKLGIGKKEDNKNNPEEAKPDSSVNQAETSEVNDSGAQAEIDSSLKPRVNLASSGIFSVNPQPQPPQPPSSNQNDETPPTDSRPTETAGPAENKIEQIKEELKESANTEVNPESLPQTPAEHTELVPPKGPLFSGIEGAFSFDKAKIEYKDLSKIVVPKELLSKIPENIARSYKSVAFEQTDDTISVAMVDPEDIETREMLKRLLGEKVKVYLATESDIASVMNQYQGLENEVSSAIAKAEEEDEDDIVKDSKKSSKIEADTISDDAPAAKIVSSLLKRAIRDKASDIHIEPTEKEVEVRFRLDGVLRKKVTLPKDIQAAVVSRIKILSNLKIDEQRVPQDGRFNMQVDNRRVDFRVSSMPIAFGEKIVMRILDKDNGILTIEELGIGGSGLKTLEANLTKSHGMVLVTGPTGSGKSTTLYAMIQKVFNEGVNIITLEDPIEYQMRGINQSQVNSDIGYTFAAGLRSILRQDPDIIMLGEIRDKETAEMAVHAALTGHVVLSTLHTNDAAGAAPRMIDMGVEPFLLTSSINVVIGQRLVRKICSECREEIKLPEEELEAIRKEIDKMPTTEREQTQSKDLKFFKGKGCKSCDNSGYKGRIGIYEVLAITPEMQQLILKRVSSEELNTQAINQGMVTMIQDGILKALEGVTSMEEIWRATKS